ncbi:MAG: hypothetical protein RLZZ200_2869 [Pseudomonadota bacterium]|jgi:N-acetylmuramoyl-L-alanine amidase
MRSSRFRSCQQLARVFVASVLMCQMVSVAAADTEIRGFQLRSDAESAEFALDLRGGSERKVFTLENPARVVIDLPHAQLASGVKLPAAQGIVKRLRLGSQPGETLRLVLDLESSQAHRSRFEANDNGGRLSVAIGRAEADSPPVVSKTTTAETPAATELPPVPVVENVEPAKTLIASTADSPAPPPARTPRRPGQGGRDIVVAIDAGHGGTDPGAIGHLGTQEKDVTLAIARALARRVSAEPGMKAYLTRDGDYFVVLRDRIVKARSARADLFVSVHADSVGNPDVGGSSVYVLSEKGATNEAARWLAERENAADLKGGVKLARQGTQLASLLLDLTQTASIGSSMEAAERILTHLDRVGEIRKSQVQQAGFVVLKSPDIPSMLVETAYISNPNEEAKLRAPGHQEAIANAIFSGLRDYFRRNPPDGTLYAQQKGRGALIASAAR